MALNEYEQFTCEDIKRIITTRLPQWKQACDNPAADMVVLSASAFGNTRDELLLFAIALKYATLRVKEISVIGTRPQQSRAP